MNFYYASLIINAGSTATLIALNYVLDKYLREEDRSLIEATAFGLVGISALLITNGIFRRYSREMNSQRSEEMETFSSDRASDTRNPYHYIPYDPGRCLG